MGERYARRLKAEKGLPRRTRRTQSGRVIAQRALQQEKLEDRVLLAVGPQLISVQPNFDVFKRKLLRSRSFRFRFSVHLRLLRGSGSGSKRSYGPVSVSVSKCSYSDSEDGFVILSSNSAHLRCSTVQAHHLKTLRSHGSSNGMYGTKGMVVVLTWNKLI